MRIHLVALAAILSVVGLTAPSVANANTPTSDGAATSSSAAGGGVRAGGGGFAGGRVGGSGYVGGGAGGGGFAGRRAGGSFVSGHFMVRGFRGGRFGMGGTYRGGSDAFHARGFSRGSGMTHGGYVVHGHYSYRIVGSESAGVSHGEPAMRGLRGAPNDLALGPRIGSAAAAARRDPMPRADLIRPFPGHLPTPQFPIPAHPRRAPPHRPPVKPTPPARPAVPLVVTSASGYRAFGRFSAVPMFCDPDSWTWPFGCPRPRKMRTRR